MRIHIKQKIKKTILYGTSLVCIYLMYLMTDITDVDRYDPESLLPRRQTTSFNRSSELNATEGECRYTGKPAAVLSVNITKLLDWARLEANNPDVKLGGHWRPNDCNPRDNVAFVLPYRDRETQLYNFLKYMHPFLREQKIAYTFYVVEQISGKVFNRGLVKNAGFLEVSRLSPEVDCVIFHDTDLLPLDGRNVYSCPRQPRHMCLSTDYINNFMSLYKDDYASFGGVVAFTKDDFNRVNGYSNIYVGWGAEDDDLLRRVRHEGMQVERYPDEYGRYFGVQHESEMRKEQPYYPANKFKLLHVAEQRIPRDGLNTSRYHVINVTKEKLFTRVLIEVEQESYIQQAITEELVYKKLYGNMSPYWKNLNFTPKPYWWIEKPKPVP